LEAHETVDQQAGAERRDKAILCSGEVGVCSRARRSDTGIENQRDNGQEEVDVEEGGDFLSAYECMLVLHTNNSRSDATYRQQ
jgi:hypothetical protein